AKKTIDVTKQHECYSAEINCSWNMNFNNCKSTTQITCTSFDDKHNHELNLIILQTAPQFCKLSKEMIENIKFYTCSTKRLGAKMQYNLLKKTKTDAAETLQQLITLKAEDSE
ncbi:6619_t:CDS:2, partial [Cetraspora pellucida]